MPRHGGVEVPIASRDAWFKVVGMLQQNWAFIDAAADGTCTVHFVDDASGVFDRLAFASVPLAEAALRRNRFERFATDPEARAFLSPPTGPYHASEHPSGPIYSSGKYWR